MMNIDTKSTFTQIPYDRQLALYENAAQQAIGAYDLGGTFVNMELISAVNNATFKVTVDRHPARKHFALRIHRPGKTSHQMLQAELSWLIALRKEAGLLVPKPVATADGMLWTTYGFEECQEPFDCVLFEWIDGQFLATSALSPALAGQIGQFVARLHLHSQHFSLTPGLVRRRLDTEQFFDWPALRGLQEAKITTDAHMILFETVADRVRQTLTMLGKDAEVFGLIHTDLIAKNYFFHVDGVGTVDFDDCSWGYYAYDMAATLIGFADEPMYRALRAAYLEGYRSSRPFSIREEQTLDVMMAARHLLSCCWIATHLDSPGIAQRAKEIIGYRATVMHCLIEHRLTIIEG